MNRAELEQKTKSIAQDLAVRIKESPLGAASVFIALGFVVGVFRGLAVPLLLVVALVYGVFWLLDGGKSKGGEVVDTTKTDDEEGDSLH